MVSYLVNKNYTCDKPELPGYDEVLQVPLTTQIFLSKERQKTIDNLIKEGLTYYLMLDFFILDLKKYLVGIMKCRQESDF